MRTVPSALLAHMQGENVTLATCWLIEKRDGSYIRGTDHDEDLDISTSDEDDLVGTYAAGASITASDIRSTADGAVDNMEVSGATPPAGSSVIDVNVADIEAGLFDGAWVTVFVCNWQAPDDGQLIVKYGMLGEVARNSDHGYTVELRGLKQLLSQVIVETYGERCSVKRFGDSRCKFNTATVQVTGTITAVTNAKRFDATLSGSNDAGYFNGGELEFTSGANEGYMREVKRDDNDGSSGSLSFWERFPNDPEVGDTFTLTPGCPRTLSACKDKYDNVVNFRGYGVFIQGMDALMKGPT